jgi:hypothetical protein
MSEKIDAFIAEAIPFRWLRQGGAAIALVFFGLWAVADMDYGMTGFREPTIRNGAFGIGLIDPMVMNDCIAAGFTAENDIFAAAKPSRIESASEPPTGGTIKSKRIPLFGFMPLAATFQWARWSTFEICNAKKSASGSPSCQNKFTDPGLRLQTLINLSICSAEIVRQTTTAFNLSVSSRAVAASFSNWAARTFAFDVSRSFSDILRSEKYSLAAPILIEPIVPINTAAAPMTRTTFESENRKSAAADEMFHIRTRFVLGFFSICILGMAAVFVSLQRVRRDWTKWH